MLCQASQQLTVNCDKLYFDTRDQAYSLFDFSQIAVKTLLLNVKQIVAVNQFDCDSNEFVFDPSNENTENEIGCWASYSFTKFLVKTGLVNSLDTINFLTDIELDYDTIGQEIKNYRIEKPEICFDIFEPEELGYLNVDLDQEGTKITDLNFIEKQT